MCKFLYPLCLVALLFLPIIPSKSHGDTINLSQSEQQSQDAQLTGPKPHIMFLDDIVLEEKGTDTTDEKKKLQTVIKVSPQPKRKQSKTDWGWIDYQCYDCLSCGSCLMKAGCCEWSYCIKDIKTDRLPLCTSEQGSCKNSCTHCASSSFCASIKTFCSLCGCLCRGFCISSNSKSMCHIWSECAQKRSGEKFWPWGCIDITCDILTFDCAGEYCNS